MSKSLKHQNQSGRSFIEILGILGVISAILLGSIVGLNALYKYYKRRETVKQMNTIVTGYRSSEINLQRNGVIRLKNLVPEAEGNTLNAKAGGTFSIRERVGEAIEGTFQIVTTGLDNYACRDIVLEGNYDAVYYQKTDGTASDIYSPKTAKNHLTEICDLTEAEILVNKIKKQYFLYTKGKECKYLNELGKCSDCPMGEVKDKYDHCCLAEEKSCDICGGCPVGQYCQSNVCLNCPMGATHPPSLICYDKITVTAVPTGCSAYSIYNERECDCTKDDMHTPKWQAQNTFVPGKNYYIPADDSEYVTLQDGTTKCYKVHECSIQEEEAGKCYTIDIHGCLEENATCCLDGEICVNCCNGVCCNDDETCKDGVCTPKMPEYVKCKDPQAPFRTADGRCVQCIKDEHCGRYHIFDSERGCRNNVCVYTPCNMGTCQICNLKSVSWTGTSWKPEYEHHFVAAGEPCEQSGVQGQCDGYGICNPVGTACRSIDGCPSGQFCNFGGTFNSGAKQAGIRGATPNICEPVRPITYTTKNKNGQSVTYYYPSREDLRSWCRAADESQNCNWGYLAYPGAQSWCRGINKNLLTSDEFTEIVLAAKQIENIELIEKVMSDSKTIEQLIQKISLIQEKITHEQTNEVLNQDQALAQILYEYPFLEPLISDCQSLDDLNQGLNNILKLLGQYTNKASMNAQITYIKGLANLYRNLAKPFGWGGELGTISYWVQGGSYTGGTPYSGRPDGYYGMGSVICK